MDEEKTVFLPKESPPASPGVVPRSKCGQCNCKKLLLKFRSKHILGVEPVMFLFMFGILLQGALFQQYTYNRYGQEMLREEFNYTGSFNICLTADVLGNETHKLVTEKASYLSLVNGVTSGLPGIVAALMYGPLSDRIGRRPLMVLIAIGGVINAALTLTLMYLDWQVELLVAINAISGLVGGLPGMLTVIFAYTADVTSRRWLTLRLGILEAMIFVGGALAVLINGQWLRVSNCTFPDLVYLYLSSNLIVIGYVLVWLPESLTRAQRKEKTKDVSTFKVVTRGFRLFFIKEYTRWVLWFAVTVMFIGYFLAVGVSDINTLFLLGPPLKWDPGRIGVYQAITQAMFGVAMFTLLPILVACKVPDPVIMLVGFTWGAATSTAIGFVKYSWQMFAIGILSGVQVIGYPPIRSIMSKAVDPKDQGALFSMVATVQVFASVCATVLFYFLLPWFTISLHWPAGYIYFVTAILCVLIWPFGVVFLADWAVKRARSRWRKFPVEEKVPVETEPLQESTVSALLSSNALYYGTSHEDSPTHKDRVTNAIN